MILAINVELHPKRCIDCRRWFACESSNVWVCGGCEQARHIALQDEIKTLVRRVSALKGALKRKRRKP